MHDTGGLSTTSASLPSLPYVSHEILLALNEPEVDIARVAETVNRDPALTARLISMANSAFFRGKQPAYSVAEAMMRLGMNRVRMMAVSIVLAQQLDTSRCPAFEPAIYWYNAMACSHAASQIGRYVPIETGAEAAHLCGLMHSIGELLLVHTFPGDMQQILCALREDPTQEPALLERRQLGFDRYTAGAMLLREWELPAVISDTIQTLAEPDQVDAAWSLQRLLRGSMNWVAADFDELPLQLEDPDYLPEGLVNRLRDDCQKEQAMLRGLASLLGH